MTVVVDDYEMGISHVIRGEDHISNTPRQILIQEALGFSRPKYAHLPLILGPDRTKLSKRHGAESLSEYRKDYLPEAIFNFLAFLGWHPKDDREILTKEELINEFSLERVQKGGAIFDTRKLEWMNTEYIRKKSPKELLVYFKDIGRLDGRLMSKPDDLEKIIALEQPRLKKLSELPEKTAYFFEASEYPKELLRWKGTQNYQLIRKHLEKIIELWPDSNKVMSYADKEGRGEVLWPFRVALSGRETSPGPFEIGEILGREETLRRIKKALELLG
jgi:glutamyl/glutaminyl-tRNA synthetase